MIQYSELSTCQCSVDEIVKRVLSGRSVFEWDTLWSVGAQEKLCSTLPFVLHSFGKTIQASAYLFVNRALTHNRISAQKPLAHETPGSIKTCL